MPSRPGRRDKPRNDCQSPPPSQGRQHRFPQIHAFCATPFGTVAVPGTLESAEFGVSNFNDKSFRLDATRSHAQLTPSERVKRR